MNNCQYQNIKRKILKENSNPNYCLVIGPTGPAGPATIEIGETVSVDSDAPARVINMGNSENVKLMFEIPQGKIGPTGPVGLDGAQGVEGLQGIPGEQGLPGATGPMGPTGPAIELTIGEVTTGDAGTLAQVTDTGTGTNHIYNFVIPRGEEGPQGEIGPTGPAGTSVTILGSYDNIGDLESAHPTGNAGESYLVDANLYVWSPTVDDWVDVGVIRGPQGNTGAPGAIGPRGPQGLQGVQGVKGDTGPQGEAGQMGPTGPTGPEQIKAAYLTTFNQNYPSTGLEIAANNRIPIERLELQTGNIVKVNDDYTISFNLVGYYHITFMVSGYVNTSGSFNYQKDFISVGFRRVSSDSIFVGDSAWVVENIPTEVHGEAIISVADLNSKFELANVTYQTMYLLTPFINNIDSNSYFTNQVVRLNVEYLGNQRSD